MTRREIPTMTIAELAEEMRCLGLTTCPETLSNEIAAGVYPFAHAVRNDEGHSKKRTVRIYTKLFWKWADERTVEVEVPSDPAMEGGQL